jgi:hypothetical protein
LPIIVPLAIAQVHVNSSAHTILCGFESGRPTPYLIKAVVLAEYLANGPCARPGLSLPQLVRPIVFDSQVLPTTASG